MNLIGESIFLFLASLIAGVALIVLASRRLKGFMRIIYIVWLFSGMSWVCLIGMVQLVDIEAAALVSRGIFMAIQATVLFWIIFTIFFTGQIERYSSPVFILFATIAILLVFGSAMGLVGERVIYVSGVGYRPVYGKWHMYFAIFNSFAVAYYAYLLWKGGRLARYNEILRFQIRYYSKWTISAAIFILICNAILPAFFGYNRLAIVGQLSFLIVYGASLHLLLNHRKVYLKGAIDQLSDKGVLIENTVSIRKFLYSMGKIFMAPGVSRKDILPFVGFNGTLVSVGLNFEDPQALSLRRARISGLEQESLSQRQLESTLLDYQELKASSLNLRYCLESALNYGFEQDEFIAEICDSVDLKLSNKIKGFRQRRALLETIEAGMHSGAGVFNDTQMNMQLMKYLRMNPDKMQESEIDEFLSFYQKFKTTNLDVVMHSSHPPI